jgi:hypothetical protein
VAPGYPGYSISVRIAIEGEAMTTEKHTTQRRVETETVEVEREDEAAEPREQAPPPREREVETEVTEHRVIVNRP